MTNIFEIEKLIKNGENEMIEFKQKEIIDQGKELAREFVALANTSGGQIIIGVKNDKSIEGVEVKDGDEEKIMNYANDLCDPPINPKFDIGDYQLASPNIKQPLWLEFRKYSSAI